MAKPYALISVFDKEEIVDLAQAIVAAGYEILSTGGTAKELVRAGIPVRMVADYTGFPEMMGGRVKTLHPKVHGGLLARRDREDHYAAMVEHEIESIDLIVVNLYPFVETVLAPGAKREAAIEQIDIGGPAMIRSAAKNHDFVCVVTDRTDYPEVKKALASGAIPVELRRKLAAKAFAVTSDYDSAISCYLAGEAAVPDFVPSSESVARALEETARPVPANEPAEPAATIGEGDLCIRATLERELRYGENPHQSAAFFRSPDAAGATLATAELLSGNKELSYNNLLDLDAVLSMVLEFSSRTPACVIIKHSNPCGAALGTNLAAAYTRALACDPAAAFGSIVGCNVPVDRFAATQMAQPGNFIECLIAPAIDEDALEVLKAAKFGKNLRILATGPFGEHQPRQLVRSVSGGFLAQELDAPQRVVELEYVTVRRPNHEELRDLRFAWAMCKHVKSNAIVFAKDQSTVGIGAGQMSRVDSVEIAARKAGDRAQGAVVASDAFFPFADGLIVAADAGVTAVIQPGGSRRDGEVIAAANEREIAMVFTGVRHFKH